MRSQRQQRFMLLRCLWVGLQFGWALRRFVKRQDPIFWQIVRVDDGHEVSDFRVAVNIENEMEKNLYSITPLRNVKRKAKRHAKQLPPKPGPMRAG